MPPLLLCTQPGAQRLTDACCFDISEALQKPRQDLKEDAQPYRLCRPTSCHRQPPPLYNTSKATRFFVAQKLTLALVISLHAPNPGQHSTADPLQVTMGHRPVLQ